MHNESGFTVPTPFGDAMDVLHTDAESWLLSRCVQAYRMSSMHTCRLETR